MVIVNQSFVQRVLGGRNPIGRQLRFILYEERVPHRVDRSGPWHQIVGVVPDMGMSAGDDDPKVAGIYQPAGPVAAYPLRIAVHLKGAAGSFAPKLREVAGLVDPALSLDQVATMDQLSAAEMDFLQFWLRVLATVSAIALVLSLSGIYAVMALTVVKRRREIGVRVALGASQGSVVVAIAARSATQVALGIVFGAALASGLVLLGNDGAFSLRGAALVAAYAVLMLGICLSALAVPTRRALRVEPTEALRADG